MRYDTRPIHVDAEGIKLSKSAVAIGEKLCDFCSFSKSGCELPVFPEAERCGSFSPPLLFIPPLIGLDKPFTTFRSSVIWYRRALAIKAVGGTVGLVNSETRDIFGHATIGDVHHGPYHEMMSRFAVTNHLCLGKDMTPEQADAWLRVWIRNKCGSLYVKGDHQPSTTIWLIPTLPLLDVSSAS